MYGTSAWAQPGYTVVARDGVVGTIEHVIRSDATHEPRFLVVRLRRLRRRYPVVSWSLVDRIDHRERRLFVRAPKSVVRGLPERLPLVC